MLKYLDEYRDPETARRLLDVLHDMDFGDRPVRMMEICGTHTVAIFRSGLKKLLPPGIQLVSGPGCPVCVTADEDIDRAVRIARLPNVIVTTFGDLVRVPGSFSSLQEERSKGADVRIVYSSLDALEIARNNPGRQVVFLAVGFETTAPTTAAAVRQASALKISNFSVFSAHKLLPPAMHALLNAGELHLDGFLCPGHVSIIIGAAAYRAVTEQHRIPCVVTGFEPLDILRGIVVLADLVRSGKAETVNEYRRAVNDEGNTTARRIMDEIFEPVDSAWRGLGIIPGSGLAPRSQWAEFDALKRFDIPYIHVKEHPGCRCGEVLRGVLTPPQCGLFKKVCTPSTPRGPCMVSGEGTCGAYFRYHESE